MKQTLKQASKQPPQQTSGRKPTALRTPATSSAYRQAVARARAKHDAKVQQLQLLIGYVVVALSVVGTIGLCLARQIPVPVAIGLLILVGFRVFALRNELRRQAAEETSPQSVEPSGRCRSAAGRV